MSARKNQKYILISNIKSIFHDFRNKMSGISLPEYSTFSIYAIFVGAAAGLGAVFLHEIIHLLHELFFNFADKELIFLGTAAVIILPPIGMLIQSYMIKLFPKTAKKKGVSDVIKSVALNGGHISFKTTIFHFIAPVICIATGGTVGPEGPAAQTGGGLASKFAGMFGLSDSKRRIFTAAGSGAAIAAIFNSPLGGVFFALEIVLLNDFQASSFSALILASVTGSAISRIFLGNKSIFHFSPPIIGDYSNFYIYIILGLFAGFLSLLFIRYSSSIEHLFKTKIYKVIPKWAGMLGVGLIMGISGFFFKDIFGVGYSGINKILAGSLAWQIVLILLVLKFLLVPLILGSGGFGGLFSPSLFLGATFGYLFTLIANSVFGLHLAPTTFILVSMGAVLGGISTIPITGILIIFEMTKDYTYILPLMLAVVMSTTLVQLILKGSVHIKHLEALGYQIKAGKEMSILQGIKVKDIELKNIELIPEQTPLPKLVGKIMENPTNTFYTINLEGKISGTISETELRAIITDYDSVKDFIVAKDIMNPKIITVDINEDLDHVLKLFGKWNLDQFPVVNRKEPDKVLGAITQHQIIEIYNHESLKFNLADGLSTELKTVNEQNPSHIASGYSIIQQIIPLSFVNKTLAELRLRNQYGVEVLMIKHIKSILSDDGEEIEIITPDPEYKLQRSDVLVIFGHDSKLKHFQEICKSYRIF